MPQGHICGLTITLGLRPHLSYCANKCVNQANKIHSSISNRGNLIQGLHYSSVGRVEVLTKDSCSKKLLPFPGLLTGARATKKISSQTDTGPLKKRPFRAGASEEVLWDWRWLTTWLPPSPPPAFSKGHALTRLIWKPAGSLGSIVS